jgi:hypothetical protein
MERNENHPFKVAARVRIPLGVLRKITPKPFICKGFGMTASGPPVTPNVRHLPLLHARYMPAMNVPRVHFGQYPILKTHPLQLLMRAQWTHGPARRSRS